MDAFTINSLKGNIGTTVVIARYEAIAHAVAAAFIAGFDPQSPYSIENGLGISLLIHHTFALTFPLGFI
jgi:tetrahydromethanopterin S-methyltransferase subunit E